MPTENLDTKDSLDQLLGKKLLAFEDAPPPAAWAGIQQQLGSGAVPGTAVWKNLYFVTAAIIVFAGLAIYLFWGKGEHLTTEKTSEERQVNIRNSEQDASALETSKPEIIEEAQLPENNTNKQTAIPASAPSIKGALIIDHKVEISKEEQIQDPRSLDHIHQEQPVLHGNHKEIIPVTKDSAVSALIPDTLKKTSKPKNFYDKQRKDTSLKYRQLFK